jgi:hypothetical protein
MIREKHFNIVIILVVAAVLAYMVVFGNVNINSIIGIGGAIGVNVSWLLAIGFGLQYFQLGTKKDIQAHNIAAGIYQAGIWIALAIVIGKGIF